MLFVVSAELWCLHDDEREQDYDSGRATPDEVTVAGAFAVVLMNLIGAGMVVALRAAGVVYWVRYDAWVCLLILSCRVFHMSTHSLVQRVDRGTFTVLSTTRCIRYT